MLGVKPRDDLAVGQSPVTRLIASSPVAACSIVGDKAIYQQLGQHQIVTRKADHLTRIAGRDYSVSIRAGCPVRARVADIAGPLLGVRGLVNDGFEVKKRLPGNPHPS